MLKLLKSIFAKKIITFTIREEVREGEDIHYHLAKNDIPLCGNKHTVKSDIPLRNWEMLEESLKIVFCRECKDRYIKEILL